MDTYIENNPKNFWNIRFLDKYMEGHDGFIAGGCFKSLFLKEKIKDVDIFFQSQKNFDDSVSYFKSENAKKDGWILKYENSKVISFMKEGEKAYIELVRSIFGTPEEILRKFDFTVAKFAYFKQIVPVLKHNDVDEKIEYHLLYHKDFFEHLQTKRLVLDEDIPFPESTWERSYKYKGYGFNMCRESKIKLLKALKASEADADSISFYSLGGWD